MADVKDIKLTNDPLTNIHIMTPYLNETGRAAVSALMFGVVMGQEMGEKKKLVRQQEELVQQ